MIDKPLRHAVALFVDTSDAGIYPCLLGAERCWGEIRDARLYRGPHPVVAHPPCNLWVNMAAQNYARATRPCPRCRGTLIDPVKQALGGLGPCCKCDGTGRREPNRAVVLPAWYPGGTDGGCFAAALAAVRKYGGVLEHPAGSWAWAKHGLMQPFDLRNAAGEKVSFGGWHHGWWGTDEQLIAGEGGQDYWTCEVWQSAYGGRMRKRTWLMYCGERPPFDLRWERNPGTHQCGWFDRKKPTVSKREASATPPDFARELIRLAEWSAGA
jgi:hypothetical protein